MFNIINCYLPLPWSKPPFTAHNGIKKYYRFTFSIDSFKVKLDIF